MNETIKTISHVATKALIYEVSLSPKPGLVDTFDNGAHHDMSLEHFLNSALALQSHFKTYLEIGFQFNGEEDQLTDLFHLLRAEGVKAEATMFAATQGVNTHKGINFHLAIILGSIGYLLKTHSLETIAKHPQKIFDIAQKLSSQLLADFKEEKQTTKGEINYFKYGMTGPRGEAHFGYRTVQIVLPYTKELYRNGHSLEESLIRTLIYLMSFMQDGNIIGRGGVQQWLEVIHYARDLHYSNLPYETLIIELKKMNQWMVAKHLSPGGSADLLILITFFLLLSLIEIGEDKEELGHE